MAEQHGAEALDPGLPQRGAEPAPRILVFAGTPRGLAVVERLRDRGANVVSMIALREDDHERVRVSSEIIALGAAMGLRVEARRRLGRADAEALIDQVAPDLVLVVGWRTLLPGAILQRPRLGCVGVHDSPLPTYRGFAPVNWAVINGERRWAVSLFHLSEGVDAGDVVDRVWFDVPERSTAAELYAQVTKATVDVVDRQLTSLLAGTAPRVPQDHSLATYACARVPSDGLIDWSRPTSEIDRLIRGLAPPYPGAWTTWKGERVLVTAAEPLDGAPTWVGRIPGRVVAFTDETADVLTGDGVLRLRSLSLAGGEDRPAGSLLRSVKASLGA